MWGAALHPVPNEAESFLEDLVQAVLVRPRRSAAEDVGPPGRGTDLPRLRQGGPPHIGDHREEGVDHIGHVSPRRIGPGQGGGWRAGSLSHPCVRAAATAAVRLAGARVEDPGVPPPQGLAHSGPLGPELGAAGALDGAESEPFVLGPVTAVPPPDPGPCQEVLEAQGP